MGSCCSADKAIVVKYKDTSNKIKNVTNLEMIRGKIVEITGLKNFEVYFGDREISLEGEIQNLFKKATIIELNVKEQIIKSNSDVIPEIISESCQDCHLDVIEIVNTVNKFPEDLEGYWGQVLNPSKSELCFTFILHGGFIALHKALVKNNPKVLYFTKGENEEETKFFDIISKGNFILYRKTNNDNFGINSDQCQEITYEATIVTTKEILITQHKNKKCIYIPSEPVSKECLGFPAFSSSKLIGFVKSVSGNKIKLEPILPMLEKIKESIQKHIGDIRLPIANLSDMPTLLDEKYPQINIEFILTNRNEDDYRNEIPEEMCYYYDKPTGCVLSYCKKNYRSRILPGKIHIEEGATLTSTEWGLIIVYKDEVWKFKESKIRLPSTLSPHTYHACVFHDSKLFVISGRNSKAVEYLDKNNTWHEAPDIDVFKENASVCSYLSSIYLISGFENGILSNSVYKFTLTWELLPWKSPWSLQGMGLIVENNNFILFGGKGQTVSNRRFVVLEQNGKVKSKGELPISGFFSDKSYGKAGSIYSFFLGKDHILEYSNLFKLIVIAL